MKTAHFLAIYGPPDNSLLFRASNPHPVISRDRTAYLLRAGRSRRKNNVSRDGFHNYSISDARLFISPDSRVVSLATEPTQFAKL